MLSKKVMFSGLLVTLLFVLTVVNTGLEQKDVISGSSEVKEEQVLVTQKPIVVEKKPSVKKKSNIKKYVPLSEEELLKKEKIELLSDMKSGLIKPDKRDDFFTKKITSEEFDAQMPTDEELQNMTLDELYSSVHKNVYSTIVEEGRLPGQLDIESDEYDALYKKYTRNYSIENRKNATYTIRDDGFIPSYVEPFNENEILVSSLYGYTYNKFNLDTEGSFKYKVSDLLPVVEIVLSDYDFSYNVFSDSNGEVDRFEIEINSLPKTAEEVEYVRTKLDNLDLSGLYLGNLEEILLPEYDNDMYREIDDQSRYF